MSDTTPQRQAHQEWLDERYRQVVEQVEDYAIFTLDDEGRIATWNDGAERVLGYTEEEVLGQPGAIIFTPEDRGRGEPERELETARREGRANDERWHLRKDGGRFWANGVLSALHDAQGNPDGFGKILRDLTRQRQAQEERERLLGELRVLNETLEARVAERTEALRQSERRFSQIFHAGPVASCLTSVGDERFLDVNEAFVQLTGYPRDEVLGRSFLDLGMWSSKEDLLALERAQDEAGSFRNLELHLRTKAGDTLDILTSGEVIGLGEDRVQLKQFYDITERKQTEGQFMRAIQDVMSDTAWFSQQVLERLAQVRSGGLDPAPRVDLSKREREVLGRLASGASNEQIAAELGLATQTVRNYISVVYDKLGVNSRAEAIVWARERGIVGF